MQFVKNVLVYVFGVVTFSFSYCFYEGFIHKIIQVSQFLPFIWISYLLKVWLICSAVTKNFEPSSTRNSFFMSDLASHVFLQ